MLRNVSKLFQKIERHRNIVNAHLRMIDVEVEKIKDLVAEEEKSKPKDKVVLDKYDSRYPFLL